jgi:hypothetical protein
VKQDIDTFSKDQDHPRDASSPNRNNNVAVMIFHQNIRGLHNKIDELLNFWTTEFPHSCGDTHITAHLLPLPATLPLFGFSLRSIAQTALSLWHQ